MSRSFHYSAGSEQVFKEEGFTIRPEEFGEELTYDPENEQRTFPVVILMETDNPQGMAGLVVLSLSLYLSLSLSLSLSLFPSHST